MSRASSPTCPRCGTPLPAGAADRICPACLMSGAVKAPIDETVGLVPGSSSSGCEPTEFPREFGGYRLRGLLGRGGMGKVYEAEQISTGRRVALKMLDQQLDSPDMRQRFLREGRLAASVNHPNSLYIFGSQEIENTPVITMEIAGGGTLSDKLDKSGPLPVSEAVDAILDVISGLEAAIAGGVLHRDVKPSNCFVSPNGSIKIGDFGLSVSTLAQDDSYATTTGAIMGTPAFASPEQLRGDSLDVRADIYSVGATLYTLLTDRAPVEGKNAVQVVANAMNQVPKPLSELREDVPPGLERVVARCLAKEPDVRYADYTALRNALLVFGSREPEPASFLVRSTAGWIDFLLAFLPPYVALMFWVGGQELIVRPLVERTMVSAKYYFALLGCGFLYFTIVEGIWGAGLGKWLKGLLVVRANGRPPGVGRALIRILLPILCIEGVRMPLMLVLISDGDWTGFQTAMYVLGAVFCSWIPVLLAFRARQETGFATFWDLASGTRVVVKRKGTVRPSVELVTGQQMPVADGESLGPYQIIREMDRGNWIVATDPALRRPVWLLRRSAGEFSDARRNLARPGRLRWLQQVETDAATWDAFEAIQGVPFSQWVEDGKRVPWGTLRHLLHDLAAELWAASRDQSLPGDLSLDHVWVTAGGRAVLLDEPWPGENTSADRIPVGDLVGQQRFLDAVADHVESTSLPLHARGVLTNLKDGKFEKLSFLAGNMRGLLERPAEVSRGIRAGSVFMLPFYVWTAVFVGYYHDKPWDNSSVTTTALVVLGVLALVQLLEVPFRSTASHSIFRLAVVNAQGDRAAMSQLLLRWAIIWLPLFVPMLLVPLLSNWMTPSAVNLCALAWLLLWIAGAFYTVVHPNIGWHDRWAGTWVVRQ